MNDILFLLYYKFSRLPERIILVKNLVSQLRSESDDGMMSDQGSGFSLSVDQDDYHFRPSNVFIPATPGRSAMHATYMSIPDYMDT